MHSRVHLQLCTACIRRHKRQTDAFIDLCLLSPEAPQPPLAVLGAPSAAVQAASAAPATGCAGAEGRRSGPLPQKACSKAPAAPALELTACAASPPGPSTAGKEQPTRALKPGASKGAAVAAKLKAAMAKQLRAERKATSGALAEAATPTPESSAGEQAADMQPGNQKAGAAAAKAQAAGAMRPSPAPDAQGGRKKKNKTESAEAPAAEARPPPADFFLSASQKRAKRGAEVAAAREAERAATAEQQRKHAEVQCRPCMSCT